MGLQHLKTLKLSNQGDIQLVGAVLERMAVIEGLHRRIKGTDMVIPPDMTTDIKRFNALTARYMQDDFRHSQAELISTRNIAQWTVDVNSELRNVPTTEIQWAINE